MVQTIKRKRRQRQRQRQTQTQTIRSKPYSIPDQDKDVTATIDLKAVKHNLHALRRHAKTDIMPVLKADAYGHGLLEMARVLRRMQVTYIGVATLGEAIMLRNNGDKGRILAWLYDIDGPELKDAMNQKIGLDIAIFDETIIPKFMAMIPRNKRIKVTMFVDTGINRAGIPYEKSMDAFLAVSNCPQIELVGMMSHLVCSQIKNSPIVNEQLRKFRDLRARLAAINIVPPLVHIANTSACLNYDVSDFTLARSGSGIHGIPIIKNKRLTPTMTLTSYIIQLKEVNKGEGIGYDWTYVAPKKMRIAIIPIGYADMLPRFASNKLYLYINGIKRKVLGLISMDQLVVEAGEKDKLNDVVYIFGNEKNCPQTIYDVAKSGATIPPEIASHIGYRVNRVYH